MKKMWEKWTGVSLVKRIIVGLAIGVILALAVPQASGIGILGDVFVGALKAIAPLLVFFLVMSSLSNAGKSHGGVIRTVIILYMFSTVLAAVIAVFASMIFPVDMVLREAADTAASAPQGIVEVLSTLDERGGKSCICAGECQLYRYTFMGGASRRSVQGREKHNENSAFRYFGRYFQSSYNNH